VTNIDPELHELLAFSQEIGRYVSSHSPWRLRGLREEGRAVMSFEGDIPVGDLCVRLSFSSRQDWRKYSPAVYCDAPWIKREIQWHAPSDGSMCWVFEPYWCAMLKECSSVLTESELREMAAYWCVAGAADLVGKHHLADAHGIKDWPKEWDDWAHGDEALPQFANMKASGEFKRNAQELKKKARASKLLANAAYN